MPSFRTLASEMYVKRVCHDALLAPKAFQTNCSQLARPHQALHGQAPVDVMPTGDFQVRANGFGQRFRRQGILHIEMPAYNNIPYPHASYLSYICCHGVLIKFEQIGLCLCCQDKDGTVFCVDANAGSFGTNLCGQELVSTASAEMVKGTPDGSLLRSITRTKKDIGL